MIGISAVHFLITPSLSQEKLYEGVVGASFDVLIISYILNSTTTQTTTTHSIRTPIKRHDGCPLP